MTEEPTYRTSHTEAGYGAYYDETMYAGYQGDVWRRYEVPLLERWVAASAANGGTVAVDFACGTGRVTELVQRHFATTVGVDVSSEMLSRARARVPNARFIERDVTSGDLSGIPPADLITAFRFFQNAERELRDAVVGAFDRILSEDGQLVLNVQLNGDGPGGLVSKGRRRLLRHDVKEMTHRDVDAMLAPHGFEIVETAWYGFWPRTGPYLSGVAARLQEPARRVVGRLSLPDRRFAEMFAVRVRRSGSQLR